jgi:hypothetical protein
MAMRRSALILMHMKENLYLFTALVKRRMEKDGKIQGNFSALKMIWIVPLM